MTTLELRPDGHYIDNALIEMEDLADVHERLQWALVLQKNIDYVNETMCVVFDEAQKSITPNFSNPNDWV